MTMFDFSSVYQAYVACRRGKRTSHNTQRYEVRLLDHLITTSEALLSRRWSPARSVSFVCTRPKAREIHAADFADRVVHHILVPKLESIYEPLFIHDSYSNRKHKGPHSAVDRLQGFMRKVSCNGKKRAYFLQLDIRNFFNRIDRPILLKLLQVRLKRTLATNKINDTQYAEMLWLCSTLLAENAAEKAVRRGDPASFAAVPVYKRLGHAPDGCGLAIGNLTSQFFANVYLNELDQFVKHELKCCYYLRYVDDFVLLHASEAQLLMWRKRIQDFLENRLNLELKELSVPQAVSSGCDFLGYVTRSHYKLVRRRVLYHCIEKLNDLKRKVVRQQGSGLSLHLESQHREQLQATLASYWGHYKHASSWKLEQSIFSKFSWLNHLFDVDVDVEDHQARKLLARWVVPQAATFKGQVAWFQSCFSDFICLIQLGKSFACTASSKKRLPASAQRVMKKCDFLSPIEDIYIAPLSILKGVRYFLRSSAVAHVFIAEEGYLRSGLRQRVLRLLWQPRQSCLNV